MEKEAQLRSDVDSNRALQKRLLHEDGEVTLTQEFEFTPEIIDFLDSVTWGTEDTLYEHKRTQERIDSMYDPVLIVLRVGDQLAGMVVIERRLVHNVSFDCKAFYFRYLATKVNFRNRRYVGVFGRKLITKLRDAEKDKSFYYAYVESTNHRSMNYLKKIGYKEISTIRTMGFSRFFPRIDKRMRILDMDKKEEVIRLLKTYYRNHRLVHFNHIIQGTPYFALYEDDEIIAGVQPHPATWVVRNIPLRGGKILIRLLPYIPMIRSLFNPHKFQFIAFEGFYVKKGREEVLPKLFESVLAHFKLKSAMMWFDQVDPLYDKLVAMGKMGLLHHFARSAETRLMGMPENLTPEEKEIVVHGPYYTAGFDFV